MPNKYFKLLSDYMIGERKVKKWQELPPHEL